MEGETKLCTNCKRNISTNNFVMHEMHCRRHIVLCDECNEPIPSAEMEQHFSDLHQKVPCGLCKTQVAKDQMEHHMENICLKKQMICEYCELPFPKDGMETHADYCGSRTECCNLCQQYVMLKDMTQHELSGCTYPEPKPTPSSNGTSTSATNDAQGDPFSMSYLHEFLASDFGRVNQRVPSNRQPEHHGRSRPSRGGTGTSSISNRTNSTQQSSRNRQPTRNKSNVNVERQRVSNNSLYGGSVDLPPDMDYDTMLALQLAHEDSVNQSAHVNVEEEEENPYHGLNYHWEHFSDHDTSTENERHTQTQLGAEDNSMLIPCEVCHLEIPIDVYIEHTEYCWKGLEVNNAMDRASTSESRDRNNAMPLVPESLRPSIPVIDNLHQSDISRRIGPDVSPLEPNGDYFLPCEFCDDVYPSELILQHQVVCPQNRTATPRATTPASNARPSRRRDKDKDNNKLRAGLSHKTNDSSSTDTSTFNAFGVDPEVVGGDGDNDDDGPRSNFFRDESYKTLLQSVSDKYGGLPTRGRASFFPVPRSGRRSSREAEEDDGPPRTYEPARTNRSAQRARALLDELLTQDTDGNDNRSSSHGNNVNNHHRRGAAASSRSSNNTAGASSSSRGRKTRVVNARTVAREVTRSTLNGLISPSARSRVNGSSSTNTATSTNAASSNIARNQQRSDHVFSPELRPKPNDNRRR